MILSLINALRGYLLLSLEGDFIERFLNLCVREGIFLWHIRKNGNHATAFVSVRGFRRMRIPARKTKTRVRILKKRGLPLFLHRYRRRRAFLIGVVLFALILALLSSFIWSVEIDGTEKTDEKLIRNALKACGLDVGVVKYTLKASDIKSEMLRRMPSLSWLWVEVKGTRAFVHVREKTQMPEMDTGRPANLISEKDGVIVSIDATHGKAAVEPGDTVKKGTLLISGTLETKHGGTLLVRSEGAVLAKHGTLLPTPFPPLLRKNRKQETPKPDIPFLLVPSVYRSISAHRFHTLKQKQIRSRFVFGAISFCLSGLKKSIFRKRYKLQGNLLQKKRLPTTAIFFFPRSPCRRIRK